MTTTTPACDECGTTAPSVARLGPVALCDACRAPAPLYEKAIVYVPESRDFAELVYELINGDYFRPAA